MKRMLHISFGIILIFTACFSSLSQNRHIGNWKGSDQGQVGYINIDSADFSYFVLKNDTLGGESFMINGQEAYMKCETNYEKPLKTMDFVVYLRSDNTTIKRLLGIFKFDENDRLVLCLNFKGDERPENFNIRSTINLEKVE